VTRVEVDGGGRRPRRYSTNAGIELAIARPDGCVRRSRCKVDDGVDVNVAVDVKGWVKVIVEDKVTSVGYRSSVAALPGPRPTERILVDPLSLLARTSRPLGARLTGAC
jgi:hypothetical protein